MLLIVFTTLLHKKIVNLWEFRMQTNECKRIYDL
jgi:hypothetical protein